jgi:mono/diheme cytochrome c family protein
MAAPGSTGAPAEAEPVSAFYTAQQAERGRRVFGSVCSVCHGRNEFTGPIFELTWVAEPVGNLFQHISTTMPQDRPGTLSLEEYASVVAYMLQLNGRPAGDRELPANAELLATMRW